MRICHLVHSPVLADPRVRRHCDALQAEGWDVHAIGHAGGDGSPPRWDAIELEHASLRGVGRLIHGARSAAARPLPRTALSTYWSDARNRAMLDAARAVDADVYVANDWNTLPVAATLSEEAGVPFIYDSHEYWSEAGIHLRRWRHAVRPLVVAVEARYAPLAAGVMTVSSGIADRMQSDLGLTERPTVIRNVTSADVGEFRPTGDTVDVLYHGILNPTRRIVETIEMAPHLPPGWTVTVRGPAADPDYGARCATAAASTAGRARLEPPVPSTELVERATTSDLGIVIRNESTVEHEFALPNKLFEFFAAGLGLVVSDHAEQAALVEEYGAGIVVPRDADPRELAAALSDLDAADIDAFKRGSLAAGAALSWEKESVAYIAAVDAFVVTGR